MTAVIARIGGASRRTASLSAVATLLAMSWRAARAEEAIASQKTFVEGVTAAVMQCRRQDGVLTIVMELYSTSDRQQMFNALGLSIDYDNLYVVAGQKKYLVLRDSEGKPIARADTFVNLKRSETWIWWAKYPAPPDDITRIDYYTPLTLPFEGLPVSN